MTQISDFLRYRKIKVTDFSEFAKILEGSDKFSQDFVQIRLMPWLNMLENVCIQR